MNPLNKLRRRDAIGWLNAAAACRRNAVKIQAIAPVMAASFMAEARNYLKWARHDLRCARDAGWQLPR
jgi:hypothetical protein